MSENSYDIRAIRFIKTAAGISGEEKEKPSYICLGHFDRMHIDKLNQDGLSTDPLKLLQNDHMSGNEKRFGYPENYVYSLYVLKQISSKKAKSVNAIEVFWNICDTFTVVTRIHCDYQNETEKEESFSQIISKMCRNQTQKSSRVVYQNTNLSRSEYVLDFYCVAEPEGKKTAKVRCILYDSLELGDTVAIIKSQSLAAALELIRYFSSIENVRDTYTYCGIERKILESDGPVLQKSYISQAVLPYVSTRFSIWNNGNAQRFFNKLLKKHDSSEQFFVTGTADHFIQWKDCSEGEFLNIMQTLIKHSSDMLKSFNDIITRVGLKPIPSTDIGETSEEEEKESVTGDKKKSLLKRIKNLNGMRDWLCKEIVSQDTANWKYSLLKLLGTLEAMYSNYVMDDLAELIIPSVDAFLERLYYICSKEDSGVRLREYEEDIITFLSCWISLMNDIAQLESQMTQHPELSPVRYYIPAMLLQFTLRFVEVCSEALSDKDQRIFRPMLLPDDIRELSVFCPLDPGSESYTGSCPLLIRIPIKDLYRPWETAHRVAHEIGHFCEDKARNRDRRHGTLRKCMAEYLTETWYRNYIYGRVEKEEGDLWEQCDFYKGTMEANLKELEEADCPGVTTWYLFKSVDVIEKAAIEIMKNERYVEAFLTAVYPAYFYDNRCVYEKAWNEMMQGVMAIDQYEKIYVHISSLQKFCSECYADIAMILLLNCNFIDYYMCVYNDEYERLQQSLYKGVNEKPLTEGVICHIQRMALVIRALSQSKWVSENSTWILENIKKVGIEKKVNNPWISYALEFVLKSSVSNSGDTSGERQESIKLFPDFVASDNASEELPGILWPKEQTLLAEYLGECVDSLADKLRISKNGVISERERKVKEVQENIDYVKPGSFDWEKLQKFLAQQLGKGES